MQPLGCRFIQHRLLRHFIPRNDKQKSTNFGLNTLSLRGVRVAGDAAIPFLLLYLSQFFSIIETHHGKKYSYY